MKKYTYYFRHGDKRLEILDDGEPTETYSDTGLVTHNGIYGKMFLLEGTPLIRAVVNMRDVIATTIEECEAPDGKAQG